MLVRPLQSGETLVIDQPSHAWLSGQLARAWGNERFRAPAPWDEVCLAADQHDVVWQEWDRAPALNPRTRLPYSFTELPARTHAPMWSHAVERVRTQSSYAAVLVSLHGRRLAERRDRSHLDADDAAAVEAYLMAEERNRARLMADLRRDDALAPHTDDATISRNRRLLWTWDFLSLAVCLGWAPTRIGDVPANDGDPVEIAVAERADGTVTLDPWPLRDDRVEVRCEARVVGGPFGDEPAMRAALEAAPRFTRLVTIERA